ncbi:MAG: T9SS type A sorting domain-containing protein [Bacteroidetes bacterium]|nr:MAG: T9SS type A sorting domain-containing protein [Bacteroidota bacterium]
MSMFRFPLMFAALALLSSPAYSQSFTLGGTVKDSVTALGIDSVKIEMFDPVQPASVWTAYTNASGQWSYTVTSVHEDEAVPQGFALHQNYPNPFNPSTMLAFSLSAGGAVTVSVHTVLGQRIAERTFDLAPGAYRVPWNGAGAAGTYFYTVRYGGRSYTRKMVQLDGAHAAGGFGEPVQSGSFLSAPLGKRGITDVTLRFSRLGYEPDSLTLPAASNQALAQTLTTVHHRALVFDLHNDIAELMVDGYQMGTLHTSNQSDIPRFRTGGVDAQMFVLWPDPNSFPSGFARTKQMYDTVMAQVARNASAIAVAKNTAELHSVLASGRIAAVLCVEGGTAIDESLEKLKTLYSYGARYMTITWNNSFSWAVAAADAQSATKGLSDFGKDVIRTMDTLGMLIDVSHTGIKTIDDILTVTKNPIIASHSGARTLRNHTRNLTDAQLQAIAASGGVVGVVFHRTFITSTSTATIDTVMKHIDYIKNLVGVDHVAVGSDYDGGITPPVGLENVSKLPALTMAMFRRGYTKEEVKKILGGNYLRVFTQVCK